MSRKRIVVMGFMAGCPIAGVVWQHIHYIVGLQRLGHEVYYIEDSARLPYDPVTFEITNDYGYALKNLARLAAQFGFQDRWAFCARYLPDEPCAGLSIEKVRELYLIAFSREPNSVELSAGLEFLAETRTDSAGTPLELQRAKQESFQDLIWALINTKEFLFNH